MSTNRLNVFPSRMVLTAMKDRLKAAKKGHSLLKQKSDAIKMNLHKILKEILVTKREVGVLVRDAAFSHTEAVFAAGEFNNDVIQNVSQASYRIRATIDHTAGTIVDYVHGYFLLGGCSFFIFITCSCTYSESASLTHPLPLPVCPYDQVL